MSELPKDGGPAFPEVPTDLNAYEGRPGMSLRDWFAGQALAAIIEHCRTDTDARYSPDIEAFFAKRAYGVADAMLEARGK